MGPMALMPGMEDGFFYCGIHFNLPMDGEENLGLRLTPKVGVVKEGTIRR
jgi:hypothetical protein